MHKEPCISRQGQSIQFGISSKGLYLLATSKNRYKSEILMREQDLPLDWKRPDIARSARNCLKRLDYRENFFIVGMSGYETVSEKALYCLDGSFNPVYKDNDWFHMNLNITTYEGYQPFVGTRQYWIPIRTTEVIKLAQFIEDYWE